MMNQEPSPTFNQQADPMQPQDPNLNKALGLLLAEAMSPSGQTPMVVEALTQMMPEETVHQAYSMLEGMFPLPTWEELQGIRSQLFPPDTSDQQTPQ